MPKRTSANNTLIKNISLDQLERLTTHELADVLSNVVMLLRRMPNITWQELQSPQDKVSVALTTAPINGGPVSSILEETPVAVQAPSSSYAQRYEELNKKLKADLEKMAKDLNILVSSKMSKKEIISKILARQSRQDGHSEQYAIQNL